MFDFECDELHRSFFLFHVTLLLGEDVLLLLWGPESTVQASVGVSCPWAPLDWYATVRGPHVDRLRVLLRLGVDADIDSSIQAVLDGLANERNLHHWIIAALLSHVEKRVCCVGSNGLLVGVVRRRLLHLTHEVLLDIELANVRDGTALNGVVGKELSTMVDDGYDC